MASNPSNDDGRLRQPLPPFFSRVWMGAAAYILQGTFRPISWIRDYSCWYLYPELRPNFIKTYECRPWLPVRVFFPSSYDQTSPQSLPTVFCIHGGGFVFGSPGDDDECNRAFADTNQVLVVELNYAKAPYSPFPIAIHDVEALILATYDDASLPMDRKQIAVMGYSAGGNLALAVCQLASVRERIRPSAVIPVYPVVDYSLSAEEKVRRRYFKETLSVGLRSQPNDYLSSLSTVFGWSYVPYGHDLCDPLLSPVFAARDDLPPHIYVIGAELDQLGHEGWRFACKMAGRPEPSLTDKVGQAHVASEKGQLILDKDRYAFEDREADGTRGVNWLLVPDQVHGFDHLQRRMHGGEESYQDARLKTALYYKRLGDWLHGVVWKQVGQTST